MENMYEFNRRARQCYQLLQDELSRRIFRARLTLDFDQSPETVAQIVCLGEQQKWLDAVEKELPAIQYKMEQKPKNLVLYGTNATGHAIASLLVKRNINFYGFCGRRAKEFPNGLMGKPVISPDYLFQNPDDFYVILAVADSADEVKRIVKENHFPQEQILASLKPDHEIDHQYFEFPSLFHHGTAFVDGGCLNCRTSYLFADWCGNGYSKIFAYEPDPISYSICKKNLLSKEIRDFQLIQAGLSDHEGEVLFRSGLFGCSHIIKTGGVEEKNSITVPVTTIDDTVGEEKVGFIKMDIEGAEFDALHGAKKMIVRDKPLLAISVYHREGDMLAIMDYLRCLEPEYRFWLRHYSIGIADTVLYASVDEL